MGPAGVVDVHITSCALFLILGLVHVFYNWRVLRGYVYSKARRDIKVRAAVGGDIDRDQGIRPQTADDRPRNGALGLRCQMYSNRSRRIHLPVVFFHSDRRT